MPEHACLAIAVHGMQGAVDRLVDAEVLMVCGENLRGSLFGLGEADEIAENVEQPFLREHAVKQGGPPDGDLVGDLRVIAVSGLPLHETILAGRDGTDAGIAHIGHHAERVIREQGRDDLHVVAQLQVGIRRVDVLP